MAELIYFCIPAFDRSLPMFFYLLVTIGNVRRLTNVAITDDNNRVRIDSLMHFSIRVSIQSQFLGSLHMNFICSMIDYSSRPRLEFAAGFPVPRQSGK
jgi:hypothetical protein